MPVTEYFTIRVKPQNHKTRHVKQSDIQQQNETAVQPAAAAAG
jgi:hypothetical protein